MSKVAKQYFLESPHQSLKTHQVSFLHNHPAGNKGGLKKKLSLFWRSFLVYHS